MTALAVFVYLFALIYWLVLAGIDRLRLLGLGGLLFLVAAQIAIEAPYPQMFPAYGAAFFLTLGVIVRRFGGRRGWLALRHGSLPLLLVGLWAFHAMPVFRLAPPSGPYPVGTRLIELRLEDYPEPFTADPNDVRTLYAQVWYPAEPGTGAPAPYWFNDGAFAEAVASFQSRWQPMWGWLYWHMDLIPTHARLNAEPLGGNADFPLVVFSHGHPVDPYNSNTSLLQDLASQGFVAIALAHPYETPAALTSASEVVAYDINNPMLDTRIRELQSEAYYAQADRFRSIEQVQSGWDIHTQIQEIMPALSDSVEIWQADIDALFDNLASADGLGDVAAIADMDRLGVIGFSLGGATATRYCSVNARCKVGVNLDGYVFGDMRGRRLDVPFLFMNSETNAGMNDFYMLESNAESYRVNIPASRHINFTDFTLAGPYMRMLGAIGPGDGETIHRDIRRPVVGFFKAYLRCEPKAWFAYLGASGDVDMLTNDNDAGENLAGCNAP